MSLKPMVSTTPSLTLHKFTIIPDEDDTAHHFTLVLDNFPVLLEGLTTGVASSVDSTDLSYAGQRWSVLVQRSKDNAYLGVFLKWRYGDQSPAAPGGVASSPGLSCKVRYRLTVVNRHDVNASKHFSSNQLFSTTSAGAAGAGNSGQTVLGKSRMLEAAAASDCGAGWTDCTGRQLVITLVMSSCVVRYRAAIATDASARQRARKNASGAYYDTPPFLHCGHRWYLRAYPSKGGGGGGGGGVAAGEPAVYLYLANRSRQVSMEVCFTLSLADRRTEILTYGFGEGAKYDGFGKTLTGAGGGACRVDVSASDSLVAGVEIISVGAFKDVGVSLSPVMGSVGGGGGGGGPRGGSCARSGHAPAPFNDHEGNTWRLDYRGRECATATFALDKAAAGHYTSHARGKLVAFSGFLLAQDPEQAQDVDMTGGRPVVARFSNSPDDRPARFTFPLDSLQVLDDSTLYCLTVMWSLS